MTIHKENCFNGCDKTGNIFDCGKLPSKDQPELTEALLTDDEHGLRIERIISTGQTSPPGFWYDQQEDEWVVLLQGTAELEYRDGGTVRLEGGDWLLIPAHRVHRVAFTSSDPFCVWLAVFKGATDGNRRAPA